MRNEGLANSSSADAAAIAPDLRLRVRRRWYSRLIGVVRLGDLRDFRWFPAGRGRYGRPSAQWFLHARVLCTQILEGAVGHSCKHGPPPHLIRVCLTRKDNPASFRRIESLAPRPEPRKRRKRRRKPAALGASKPTKVQ
jgi:hypothetical protein